MFSTRDCATALEQAVPRITRALQDLLDGCADSKRLLFHRIVEASAAFGRAVARIAVEEIACVVNTGVSRTNPYCRNCKRRMDQTRPVQIQPNTSVGVVSIWRDHYSCSRCIKQNRYPFDEQVGLTGQVGESLVRDITLLGASLPYRTVASTLEQLKGTSVSSSTCHKKTTEVAHDLLERLDDKDTRIFESLEEQRQVSKKAPRPHRLYITIDGAMANIRNEGWKEIRLSALWSESKETSQEKARRQQQRLKGQQTRRRVRKKGKRSNLRRGPVNYVVRFRSPEEFAKAVYARALEMGLRNADEVVVVADGAPWIWKIVDDTFPQAVRILDWYHAMQRVWKAANAIYGPDSQPAKAWVRRRKQNLLEGRTDLILRALRRGLQTRALNQESREVLRLATGYFSENKDKTDYESHLLAGRDIGSGRVEAGCKRIVGARLKATGCRWAANNVEAIAVLRAEFLSGRLQALWSQRDRDMLRAAISKSPRQARNRAA